MSRPADPDRERREAFENVALVVRARSAKAIHARLDDPDCREEWIPLSLCDDRARACRYDAPVEVGIRLWFLQKIGWL